MSNAIIDRELMKDICINLERLESCFAELQRNISRLCPEFESYKNEAIKENLEFKANLS